MNKYMAFIGAWLWVSAAMAGECVGGKWMTANSVDNNPNGNCTAATCNGASFCKSNGTINWWSAFTWCASNGLKLAKFQEMCPGVPTSTNNVTGACPNLQGSGSGWVWSEMSNGSSYVMFLDLSSGSIVPHPYVGRNSNAHCYALCQ